MAKKKKFQKAQFSQIKNVKKKTNKKQLIFLAKFENPVICKQATTKKVNHQQ